ncbi:MAG: hypothetical protein ABI227_07120 [Rhodanobacter sp.]
MGVIGLALASAAWAGSDQPRPLPARQAATSLPKIKQHLNRSQTEVKRLEQAVARQESDSKRGNEHLQQQDQVIAQLQKQLQELRATPAAVQH